MKRTTIMAGEELLYKIERIAQQQGKSKAAVIREALTEYVSEMEKSHPIENPLLGLVGLAGDEGEQSDLSQGKDEEILSKEWVENLERHR